MPIFRILHAELFAGRELSDDEIAQLVDLTQNVFNPIAREIRAAGFWDSIPAQNRLKAELQQLFLSQRFAGYPSMAAKWKELITRLMEWARTNHDTIIRS